MTKREAAVATEEMAERALLVWEQTGASAIEFDVWPERPLTIGRDGTNSVVVESPFVSKAHAVIRYADGQFTVEDLKSANGTRINGLSVGSPAVLAPGDVLEVGDQRFVFKERAPGRANAGPVAGGLHKNTKLALTAIATLGVFGVLFGLLVSPGSQPPAGGSAQAAVRPARSAGGGVPPAPPVDLNSEAVRDVLERAKQAGIKPVDALFDEGVMSLDSGRLREAAQLLGAVVERDPKNEAASLRLAEAKAAWAQAIFDHAAEAERSYDELRLGDAILEWGKVVLLTDQADARHAAALDGIDRAQKRLGH